jgi:hypothetical protein
MFVGTELHKDGESKTKSQYTNIIAYMYGVMFLRPFGISRAKESSVAQWKVDDSGRLFIHLLTCLLGSPKANHKISMNKDGNKQK